MTRGGRLLSVRGSHGISGLTAGDGPWTFGLSCNLTLAQLEAYLENGGPTSPSETDKVEIATRGARCRQLGVLSPTGNGTTAVVYMDNVPLKGLRFSESGEDDSGWDWWLFNLGPAMQTAATWNVQYAMFVEFNPSG